MRLALLVLLLAACTAAATDDTAGTAGEAAVEPPPSDLPLDKIVLPEGFSIDVYAEDVPNARQMALTPGGTLFVGSRRDGTVHAVVDQDGDHRADAVFVIDEGLAMPSGLAFRDGALYVAATNRILRYDGIESRLADPPEPVVVVDDLPEDRHHGWKFIAFGPDGMLYVPVGAPCNVCDREAPYATILRMNADGSGREVFARGVRNSVGFDWHPQTDVLWFTDNGRDNIGASMAEAGMIPADSAVAVTDRLPECELNRAPEPGLHFGFPYVHESTVLDPEFGEGRDPASYVPPVATLGPHVAPLGMEFYEGAMFPEAYRHQVLIAEHGSWNRSEKIGYRLKLVRLDGEGTATAQEIFAEGWLQGEENWGRPVDLELMPDGSVLVSDDQAGAIYRITYTGE